MAVLEIIPPDGKAEKYLSFKYANGVVLRHTGYDVGQGVTFFGSEGRVNLMAVSGRAVFEPAELGRHLEALSQRLSAVAV